MKWKQASPASASWLTNRAVSVNMCVCCGGYQVEGSTAWVFFLGEEASLFIQKSRKQSGLTCWVARKDTQVLPSSYL